MTARILQFPATQRGAGRPAAEPFEATVDDDGCIRMVIGEGDSRRTITLTPRQAVELAAFLNNDWMARLR